MTAAGLDHRDLRVRNEFAAGWDGPPCPRATLADVVAHVEHAREVAGIDHIGIGGDYDGTADLPVGLEDVSSYPRAVRRAAGAGLERGGLRQARRPQRAAGAAGGGRRGRGLSRHVFGPTTSSSATTASRRATEIVFQRGKRWATPIRCSASLQSPRMSVDSLEKK